VGGSMPFWTFFGLQQGKATTPWPRQIGAHGQEGVLGMPRFEPDKCGDGCDECASICPTSAISVRKSATGQERLDVDYGRCVVCQLCVEACPTDAASTSFDWAFGTRSRSDLLLGENGSAGAGVPRESE